MQFIIRIKWNADDADQADSRGLEQDKETIGIFNLCSSVKSALSMFYVIIPFLFSGSGEAMNPWQGSSMPS